MMDEPLVAFYELHEYRIGYIMSPLELSEDPIDQEIFDSLASRLGAEGPGPRNPLDDLGTAVHALKERRGATKSPKERTLDSSGATHWGKAFILEIFQELRTIFCGTKKIAGPVGEKTQATITAIAAVIVHHLGVSNVTALGIAVLVLLSLFRVSKNAFCKVTQPKQLKALLGW